MIKKQEELKEYSKDLLHLNDSIKNVLSNSDRATEQQKLQNINNQFTQLYKEGKEKEAIQVIADNKEFILNVLNDNSTDLIQNLVDKVVKFDEEINNLKSKVDTYNRELVDLDIEIQTLQNSIYTAKKKDVPAIEEKIASKKEEIKLITKERDAIQTVIDAKSQQKYLVNQQIQLLQDAISNKSVASVSKEQANKALAETQKTNSNTLTAYVNQQINELEKQDPTLKDRIVVSSGLKGQNIYQEYKTSEKGIEDDPSLSKEDKLYKLLANERNAIKLLDKRLEEIEEMLADNKFDENLNKEKHAILSYEKEINSQISLHEKQVENLLAQGGTLDQEKLIESILPNYEENTSFIESNSNLSESEKLESLNQEDEKLLGTVDKEIIATNSLINKNPNDKILQNKLLVLNKIKEETTVKIENRNNEIAAGTNNPLPNREELINQLYPTYQTKTKEILSNPALDENEKLTALNGEDEKLLSSIEKELLTVKNQLAKNPSDKQLLNKQQALLNLKQETQQAIVSRKDQLASSNGGNQPLSSKELTDKIYPEYQGNKTKIESNTGLSDTEKLKALNREDEKLLIAIEKELNSVNSALAKDPTNKILQDQKETLLEMKTNTQNSIRDRNELLASVNPVSSADKKEVINRLYPQYESKSNEIKSNTSLSPTNKLIEQNKKDEKLVSFVEERLAEIKRQLAKTPNDATLLNEQKTLLQLKQELEAKIAERKVEIATSNDVVSDVNVKEIVDQIDPAYDDKTAALQSDKELSKEEQLKGLNNLDKDLIEQINDEIIQLDERIENDPSDKSLQDKMIALNTVKKDDAIKLRENEIEELESNSSNSELTVLADKVNPEYSKEIDKINQDKTLSENEKLSKLQLNDQKLISNVDDEIKAIDKKLTKDPTNQELLDEKAKLLQLKELTESGMAEREQLIENQISSELTEEELASQKSLMINKLDPAYEKKKEGIRTGTSAELSKKEAELKLKQQLLAKINSEELAVQKILNKDPFNQEAKTKLLVLQSLKNDVQNSIDQLKSDIETIKNGGTVDTISEAEKDEKIDLLIEGYADQIAEITNSGTLTDKEKKEKLLELEMKLLNASNERLIEVNERLELDPTNKGLLKEKKILEAISSESAQKVDKLINEITQLDNVQAFTNVEKDTKIQELNPEHADQIKSIEGNLNLTETEQRQQIQTEEQKLLGKVYDQMESIDNQLEEDPSNEELKKEQQLLNAIATDLERSIENRQNQINSESEISGVSELEKNNKIIQLDKNYFKDLKIIDELNLNEPENSERLLLKERELLLLVNENLQKLEKELEKDPNNKSLIKEKLVLQAIRSELERSIVENERIVDSALGNQNITSEQKTQLINAIDGSFEIEKSKIETNGDLTDTEKAKSLLDLENDFLDKLLTEKIKVQQKLDADPSNKDLLRELAILTAIQQDLETSITEHKSLINNISVTPESQIDQEKMIAEIFPDYETSKENLNNSKMMELKKVEDQIKLENELLTKLQTEEKAIKKELAKNPEDKSLQEKLQLIEQMIAQQRDLITALNSKKSELQKNALEQEVITKTDDSYVADMERLKESGSETKSSDLAEREIVHQERVTQQIKENEVALSKRNDPKLKEANEILKNELVESEVREDNFRQGNEVIASSNEKKEEFVSNLREDLLQGNSNEVTKEYSTIEELETQDQVLASYENLLIEKIKEQENKVLENPSDLEEKEQLNWLKEELAQVQTKRRKVKISIGELEKLNPEVAKSTEERFDDPELKKLAEEEIKLQNSLNDPSLTSREKQAIEKELEEVQKDKTLKENSLLSTAIKNQEKETSALESELQSTASTIGRAHV